MRVGSLFSGIGGLDLGLEMTGGFKTVWFSEIEPYPCEVLAHHWPGVPNHGDITKIIWADVQPVEVLVGGFPCQDVSVAGKRAGVKDGTRSGLWSEFARAIGVLRPRYVLIENVPGLLSVDAGAGFNRVLSDLAEMGYDAEWACVSAADVGAPHRRERVFIVAHTGCTQRRAGDAEELQPDGNGRGWPEASGGPEQCGEALDYAPSPRYISGESGESGQIRDEARGAGFERRSRALGNPPRQPQREQDDEADTQPAGRQARRVSGGAGCELADTAGNGRGEGRPEPAARERGPAPASSRYQRIFQPIPRSGFWDDWELSKPGQSGGSLCGSIARFPSWLDRNRLAPALMGYIDGYADATEARPHQILQAMREASVAEDLQWAIGRQGRVPAEAILRVYLLWALHHQAQTAQEDQGILADSTTTQSENPSEVSMRMLREAREAESGQKNEDGLSCGSPLRRESTEQSGGQSTDPLLCLSQRLACDAQEAWTAYIADANVNETSGVSAGVEPQMWRTPQGQEPGIDIERLETKDGQPATPGQRNYDKATGRMAQIGLTQEVAMRNQPARLIPPGIPLLETGRKRRVAKLKALGNAVVPQCAQYVGYCILAHAQRTAA